VTPPADDTPRAGERLAELPGVAAALAALGAAIVAAEPVTTLAVPGSRRFAFRVRLDDGRIVKLRRLLRPEPTARAWSLIEGVPDLPFPRLLARTSEIVVETWIDGKRPGAPPTDEVLAAAARVLARLHAMPLEDRGAPRRLSTATLARETLARLDVLRGRRLLADAHADRLAALVGRLAPVEAAIGVTHNDLCGENVVLDGKGVLWVVDNEAMNVGFLDYDLARTWYRWSLDPTSWLTFVDAYHAAGGATPEESAWPFWRTAAVARSAVVRATAPAADREVALARLRALAGSR
jgi:hypothetical protein